MRGLPIIHLKPKSASVKLTGKPEVNCCYQISLKFPARPGDFESNRDFDNNNQLVWCLMPVVPHEGMGTRMVFVHCSRSLPQSQVSNADQKILDYARNLDVHQLDTRAFPYAA
jgi:hypothetical protein